MTKQLNNYDSHLLNLMAEYKEKREPITVNFRELVSNITNHDRATHFVHAYPAKLLQHIPHFFLNNNVLSTRKDLVFDPFAGSGTVLLETLLAGRKAVGTDINPLAVMIAKVKTTTYDEEAVRYALLEIIKCFKASKKRKFKQPNITNLEHWYSQKSITALSKLQEIINDVEDQDLKDFFLLSFSTCTRKFSFADPKISVPVKINVNKFIDGHWLKKNAQEHLEFVDKNDLLSFFCETVEKNIKRYVDFKHLLTRNENLKPQVDVHHHDIKSSVKSPIEPNSVQLIITSPPYVSAQKYIRSSRLHIEWLELGDEPSRVYDQKSIGREEIAHKEIPETLATGNEEVDEIINKILLKNPRRAHITHAYMVEMQTTFEYLYEVLKIGGHFVMIIGNNTIAGYEFKTHEYLIKIGEHIGFQTNLVLIDDIKSRGLMTTRNKTASVISREYVVVFEK
ncbi:site-specific DNA-methyltransferase [bacterium]|nr:site-specific DNA-methyltransferase [bacterium]